MTQTRPALSLRPFRRRLASVGLPLAVACLVALPGAPTLATSPAATGCRVTNVTTGVVKKTLQGALNAAAAGATLELRGTCHGPALITRRVTIVGRPSTTFGAPVVTGDDAVRPITVGLSVGPVTIKNLVIRDGKAAGTYPANSGGGIFTEGTLTLVNVIVRDNVAEAGGGIFTAGALTLKGTTRVWNNHASDTNDGGGIYVDATDLPASLVMLGSSRVDHNTAKHGGGVHVLFGTMLMRDTATVDHNHGRFATGIAVQGSLTMEDTSAVRDNRRIDPASSGSAIELWAETVDQDPAPSFTMRDQSRVKDNVAGTGGAGVATFPDCGPDPVLSGLTAARVTGNTPMNKVVIPVC